MKRPVEAYSYKFSISTYKVIRIAYFPSAYPAGF